MKGTRDIFRYFLSMSYESTAEACSALARGLHADVTLPYVRMRVSSCEGCERKGYLFEEPEG